MTVRKGASTDSVLRRRLATDAPIGGAIYRHPRLRGRWRLETAGRKWVTLRSLEVVNACGYFTVQKVARVNWPGQWERA